MFEFRNKIETSCITRAQRKSCNNCKEGTLDNTNAANQSYTIVASATVDLLYQIPTIEEWGKDFIICGAYVDPEGHRTQYFYHFIQKHENHPICQQDPKVPGPKKIHVVRPLKPCMLDRFMLMLNENRLRFAIIEEWTEVVFQWLIERRSELRSFDEITRMALLCYGSYEDYIRPPAYHEKDPPSVDRDYPFQAERVAYSSHWHPRIHKNHRFSDQVRPNAHYLCIELGGST